MVEAHENLTQLVKKAQNNGNSLNSCFKRSFFSLSSFDMLISSIFKGWGFCSLALGYDLLLRSLVDWLVFPEDRASLIFADSGDNLLWIHTN